MKSHNSKDFLRQHILHNRKKQNTCFKRNTVSCIDLLITNSKYPFINTKSFETV